MGTIIVLWENNKGKGNCIVREGQKKIECAVVCLGGGRMRRFLAPFLPSPLAFMCMLTIQTADYFIQTAWIFCQKCYCFMDYLEKWEILKISILSQNLWSRFCSRSSVDASVGGWGCRWHPRVLYFHERLASHLSTLCDVGRLIEIKLILCKHYVWYLAKWYLKRCKNPWNITNWNVIAYCL